MQYPTSVSCALEWNVRWLTPFGKAPVSGTFTQIADGPCIGLDGVFVLLMTIVFHCLLVFFRGIPVHVLGLKCWFFPVKGKRRADFAYLA